MKLYRLFTGKDNQSHFEKLDDSETSSLFNTVHPVKGLVFRIEDRPQLSDWHPAPRRQFVIILSGQLEIGCGDGSKHLFGPGDARLVEDTTGQGHTTRQIGPEPCVTATIPLANQ
jgi:quercetin dioxygenase-like cupin family protein